MMKEQRPPAAGFLVLMISGVKKSRSRNCWISSRFVIGNLDSSTTTLTPLRSSMNPGMFPSKIFLAGTHSMSLGLTLPDF